MVLQLIEMDMAKFFDYIFVLRPTLIFPVWTVFLANYRFDLYQTEKNVTSVSSLIWVGLLGLLIGSVYIINQLKDIITDQKNEKLFIIADGHMSQRQAIVEAVLLTIAVLAIALKLDLLVGLIFIGIFIIIGIFYNINPFSWKDKPLMGIISHILGGIAVASAGRICAGADSWHLLLYAPAYAFAVVSIYLLTTLADIEGDRLIHKITFGVNYGFRVTTWTALILEMVTILLTFLMHDWLLFIPALLAFPLFLQATITQKIENVDIAIKFTLLFASLAVCWKFPFYLLAMLVTYIFSKWYYRIRFNIEYPKLTA
jgi:4-hydroxybenzoate polyprenyltransferase